LLPNSLELIAQTHTRGKVRLQSGDNFVWVKLFPKPRLLLANR